MRFFVLRDGQYMAQIFQCCHHHNSNPWTFGRKFTQIQRKSKESSKLFLLLLVFLLWLLALLPVRRRPSSACLVVRTTVIFSALRTLFVWKENHSHYAGHLEHCPKVEAISDHYLE